VAFDNSRFTFDPWKNYSGVVMEQGRVQLDSDWNESHAEIARRIQAGTLDIMGHAAYPATTPAAFQITASSGPNTVLIGCGRMYVDGLLAENHGLPANARWDPALAELSGSPQPPPQSPPPPSSSNTIDFAHQPYLPGASVPTDTASYLFYLDVWTRPVTFLEDANLIDKAVGVDTTARIQDLWQVRCMPAGNYTCATPDSQIAYPATSAGLLTTNVVPNPSAGPCCLTTGTGYTGVENQFYRVEIHQGGPGSDTPGATTATFKYSRDNASVETLVTAITSGANTAGNPASVLTVTSLGRDQVLGFSPGNWIEILDDWTELWGIAGILCQIDSISVSAKTITLTSTVPTGPTTAGATPPSFPVNTSGQTDATRNTRIIRWDQSGTVYKLNGTQLETWCDLSTTGGAIPVPASDTTLVLENGITAVFNTSSSGGSFNVGDFWTFAARTADGMVEELVKAPPRGIHHHYTKLSVVTFGSPASYPDCRTPWTCSDQGDCGCCICTVGDGVENFGKFTSINQAINSLPKSGGEVCILPGRYYEYVVINGLSDVVIRGCGSQTRLASPSMQHGATSAAAKSAFTTNSGLAAIITVVNSNHIELRSFAVEAASEAGVLLDQISVGDGLASDTDIAIEDLVITASTLPAIVAVDVTLLKIANNRIAMEDVASQWASVYASGTELHIDHNWVGLQDAPNATNWASATVVADLASSLPKAAGGFGGTGAILGANGGIHIAGGSQDVFVSDNEIEGGLRNGITLGSFVLLNSDGNDTGALTGVLATNPSSDNITLQLPPRGVTGATTGTPAAGSGLQNIQISRNRIRNMGLCGIGPVGFFDLVQTLEVISIENLTIIGNAISGSLKDVVTPSSLFGYGAICIPDVQNLIIRDNTVTDFGNTPGAPVCGIFVLNGELVDISGNQILETRDWSAISGNTPSTNGIYAGIALMYVTPPGLNQAAVGSAWTSSSAAGNLLAPLYQPGLPALRVENNVVRVALGLALEAIGFGPFSITGNHLSTGGAVSVVQEVLLAQQVQAQQLQAAQELEQEQAQQEQQQQQQQPPSLGSGPLTVAILNLGLAIEVYAGVSFGKLYAYGTQSAFAAANNPLSNSSSGAVLFTNNICQLEARASGITGFASVEIFSLDHVIFANNHCWLDGPESSETASMDALILAASLHVCSNRFQEAVGSAFISTFTFALLNMTALNISTYPLFALGPTGLITTGNNLSARF
jgi:Family of unknown function (DUF6519)